jgi:dihydropteroate synthase
MGILNVTPDSFSDGGKFVAPERAVERALQMIDEGADFIDVGGESTRPNSDAVSVEEELKRVLPVISQLTMRTNVPISIDTTKSDVAMRALDAGATIVNDVSGFHFDATMAETVARKNASVVLVHIKGTPKTMQQNPMYDDLFGEVIAYLHEGIQKAKQFGVAQIVVDPGIGFGKTQEHNLQLLNELSRLKTLGYPILVGASRKNFIGNILKRPVEQRIEGSVAAAVVAVMNGANIVRVHDVKETKRAVMIADAVRNSRMM